VSYWREEPLEVDGVLEGSWGSWVVSSTRALWRWVAHAGGTRRAHRHGMARLPPERAN